MSTVIGDCSARVQLPSSADPKAPDLLPLLPGNNCPANYISRATRVRRTKLTGLEVPVTTECVSRCEDDCPLTHQMCNTNCDLREDSRSCADDPGDNNFEFCDITFLCKEKLAYPSRICCPVGFSCCKTGRTNLCCAIGTTCAARRDACVVAAGGGPGGGVGGDPHFMGLSGGSFEFAGFPGSVYSILSDIDVGLNAQFIGINGTDSTYLGPIGVVSNEGGFLELLPSGESKLDGEAFDDYKVRAFGSLTVQKLLPSLTPAETHSCVRESDYWARMIRGSERLCLTDTGKHAYFHTKEDCEYALSRTEEYPCLTSAWLREEDTRYPIIDRWAQAWEVNSTRFSVHLETRSLGIAHIDMDVSFAKPAVAEEGGWPLPHGLLGQTADGVSRSWQGRDGEGSIEGQPKDYRIRGNQLSGTAFSFSRMGTVRGDGPEEVHLGHSRGLLLEDEEHMTVLSGSVSIGAQAVAAAPALGFEVLLLR